MHAVYIHVPIYSMAMTIYSVRAPVNSPSILASICYSFSATRHLVKTSWYSIVQVCVHEANLSAIGKCSSMLNVGLTAAIEFERDRDRSQPHPNILCDYVHR